MSDIGIHIESLSKQYHIGGLQKGQDRLGEQLVDLFVAPFRRAGKLLRGQATGAAELDTEIWALKDVSFEVKRGEVVGIIGHNGAGKSTLLKILSRITEPTEGYVDIYGRVSSLLEVGTGFHPELTGRENVFLNGAILGMRREEIERKFDEIVDFSGVEQFIDTPVKHYSSGMRVRLAFSVAAHLEPEILLIDEVLAVGDAAFQKKCLGKMGNVAREGRTVLFVSHQMAAIRRLCQRVILIDQGKVKMDGPADEVVQAYLGDDVEDGETKDIFPVMNSAYQIGFDYCHANLVSNPGDNSLDLAVQIGVISEGDRPLRRIGIGFGLSTLSGDKVARFGPQITDYAFDMEKGVNHFVVEVKNIGQMLTAGRYVLSSWLAIPGVSILVELENIAVIRIPELHKFASGRSANVDKNGPLLLPLVIRQTDSLEV